MNLPPRSLSQKFYRSICQIAMDMARETRTLLCDLREYEADAIITSFVGDAQKVLIVGDTKGRETFPLRSFGKRVIAIDIATQPDIPDLLLADVTKPLPFKDETFDCVVITEVLEHLVEDYAALFELRRVLTSDGTIVVTIPYFNDQPEFHVRIHSKATIMRLLRACGFHVDSYMERGGLLSFFRWQWGRLLHAALARLVALCGRMPLWQGYFWLNRAAVSFDIFLGKHAQRLLRYSVYYGAYLRARKAEMWDYRQVNIRHFGQRLDSHA